MNSELSPNRDDLTKEYATEEIVVEWQPRLCIHSRNCVRALPAVFQDERLSTAAVTRGMIEDYDMSRAKRAERVDAAAAAWILESALARLR